MISRELKDRLCNLSKEVLGTKNRWQKILKNGIIVSNNEPGVKSKKVIYPDLEAIHIYLLDLKKQMDEQKSKQEQTKKNQKESNHEF